MRYKRKKRNAPIATLIKNNTNKKSRTPIYRHPYTGILIQASLPCRDLPSYLLYPYVTYWLSSGKEATFLAISIKV